MRTRYALGTVSLFAITTLIAVSSAVSSGSVKSDVKAALLWIVLLFAAMSGLSRVFVREVESGTAPLLKLAAPATSVYCGKLLYNVVLIFIVEMVSIPLFLALLPPQTLRLAIFVPTLILGGWGLASASTFVAALIAQATSGKSALFFIVAFPVLMPLLLVLVQATIGCFSPIPSFATRAVSDLWVLTTYCIASTGAAIALFEYAWYE